MQTADVLYVAVMWFYLRQGERGPIGPSLIGPRGVPGIPGERGHQVSFTHSSSGGFFGNSL